jgi:hypothetical protein
MKKRIERRVKRYPVRLAIMELNGQPAADAYVVDLSSLGARLETATPLAPRNSVDFTVALPGQAAPARLSGQVVWLRPLLDRPGRFQMGVQFFAPQWDLDRLAQASHPPS